MRTRFCPITRKVWHDFDKTTHQCACGRWERGFAPAKAFSKPRSECQICERQQSLDSTGDLGNHGYKRPGWGFIVGNCPGVAHKPFPATDALVSYLTLCIAHQTKQQELLVSLPLATEFTVTSKRWDRATRKDETKDVVVYPVDPTVYVYVSYRPEDWRTPTFADTLRIRTANAESELRFVTAEIARVEARIAKGNALRGGK